MPGSCHVPGSKDPGSAQPLSPLPSAAPRDDSRRVLGHLALEGRQIPHVFIVQPLDLEVQVHVVGALAQPVLLMLCSGEGGGVRYRSAGQASGLSQADPVGRHYQMS